MILDLYTLQSELLNYLYLSYTSRVTVEVKSSVCNSMICMKFRRIIIIIISLGKIFKSYCKHITHRRTHTHTHARTHTRTRTHTHRRSGCSCSMGRWRPTVAQLTPLGRGRSLLHSNKHSRGRHGFREFLDVFHIYVYTKIARLK